MIPLIFLYIPLPHYDMFKFSDFDIWRSWEVFEDHFVLPCHQGSLKPTLQGSGGLQSWIILPYFAHRPMKKSGSKLEPI